MGNNGEEEQTYLFCLSVSQSVSLFWRSNLTIWGKPIHQPTHCRSSYHTSARKDVETPMVVTDAQVVSPPTSHTEYHQHISPPSSPVSKNNANNNIVPLYAFQRGPMTIKSCPSCGEFTRTKVVSAPSFGTWVAVVVLFFLFWPLCWVPFVNEKCKKTDHYCSKCNTLIGSARPFEGCCVTYRGWWVLFLYVL